MVFCVILVDCVKEIESFDLNNLSSENIELMNCTIQNVFREYFPVDGELVDEIPDHMKIVDSENSCVFAERQMKMRKWILVFIA